MFRSAFTLVALVGCASAQLSGVSSDCQNAVTDIFASPGAADCLATSSLIALATTSDNSSLVTPISNWLTNVCSSPKCSNATLAGVIQNITAGCASDLNITDTSITSLTSTVEQFYPTVRQALCLKDGSTNCITQFLDNFQATYGNITLSNILNLIGNVDVSSFPSNITCTDCNKAIYNELNQSAAFNANDFSPLVSKCGASFINGTTPSDVIESASNSTETATPSSASSAAFGGVSLLSHGIFTGLSGLVVISALFTLLP